MERIQNPEKVWTDGDQKRYDDALLAFTHSYGRSPTEDEENEIWNTIAYPEILESSP